MRRYCKAYHLRDLRQFKDWQESNKENEPELIDETICYLWDDYTVVRSPVQEKGVIFNAVTPEWQTFCEQDLHFALPADLQRSVPEKGVETAPEAQGV